MIMNNRTNKKRKDNSQLKNKTNKLNKTVKKKNVSKKKKPQKPSRKMQTKSKNKRLTDEQEFKNALKSKQAKQTKKRKKVNKQKSNKGKSNKKKIKLNQLLKKIEYNSFDLIPYKKKIDKGETGFLMKNDYYVNIFATSNHDYPNISENNVVIQIGQWEKFYKTIDKTNVKKIFLSLPLDTRENQNFYKRKLMQTDSPAKKRILRESIVEFEALKDIQYKQEYLFIFVDSVDNLVKFNRRVRTILCASGCCYELSVKEKINVLTKLNNPYNTGLL